MKTKKAHVLLGLITAVLCVALVYSFGYFGLANFVARAIDERVPQKLSLDVSLPIRTISPYLLGLNFEYPIAKDMLFANDTFADWAHTAGMSTARFPGGGTIRTWDWTNPTGREFAVDNEHVDPWDPLFDGKFNDPSRWMSLDEYLHFVSVSGIKPLIGVNTVSGLVFNKKTEGIARAQDEVRYVVSHGHRGAFYYLNNEDMGVVKKYSDQNLSSVAAAAQNFKDYAIAIKDVDPKAKLIWNFNQVTGDTLKEFLAVAGPYVDIVEFHSKWLHTESDSKWNTKENRYLSDWQNQYPVADDIGGFGQKIRELRHAAQEAGYPNLSFADNEYGLRNDVYVDFTPFTKGLVLIDLTQQLFIEGYDMAAMWPSNDGQGNGFMRGDGGGLNPIHVGFELLGDALGKQFVQINGVGPGAHGFAAYDGATLSIYLLNKLDRPNDISVTVGGENAQSAKKTSFVDTIDHQGELLRGDVVVRENVLTTTLPARSYTKIVVSMVPFEDITPTSSSTPPDDIQDTTTNSLQQPKINYVATSQTTFASGAPFKISWETERTHGVNLMLSCNDHISLGVISPLTTIPFKCDAPIYDSALPSRGSALIRISNTGSNLERVLLTLVPELENRTPDLGSARSIIVSVIPQGEAQKSLTATSPTPFTQELYLGVSGQEVTRLQEFLRTRLDLYPEGLVTGTYDLATKHAVERLQEAYNLGTQGTLGFGGVGVKTRTLLNALTSPSPEKVSGSFFQDLYLGVAHLEVYTLQKFLKTRPELYPEQAVTGIYDAATKRAVERLQMIYGLGSSTTPGFGGVGPKTRALLNGLMSD